MVDLYLMFKRSNLVTSVISIPGHNFKSYCWSYQIKSSWTWLVLSLLLQSTSIKSFKFALFLESVLSFTLCFKSLTHNELSISLMKQIFFSEFQAENWTFLVKADFCPPKGKTSNVQSLIDGVSLDPGPIPPHMLHRSCSTKLAPQWPQM